MKMKHLNDNKWLFLIEKCCKEPWQVRYYSLSLLLSLITDIHLQNQFESFVVEIANMCWNSNWYVPDQDYIGKYILCSLVCFDLTHKW